VVLIHGTDDRLVPYDGGGVGFTGRRGAVRSVNETVEIWTERNGCWAEATTRSLPDDTDDGTSVRVRSHPDCGQGAVRLYTVEGGGHGWPGNDKGPVRRILTGDPGREIDATSVVWRFFENETGSHSSRDGR
jgi:polyhydroxybutyrate depolymerase